MLCVTFNRFDKVGDKVVSLFKIYVDTGQTFVASLFETHKLIAGAYPPANHYDYECNYDCDYYPY